MVIGNIIGGLTVPPKSCIFMTETGQEIHAVLVDTERVLTATVNDVREGKTFANDLGVRTGIKNIVDYTHCYARIDSATGLCSGVIAGTIAFTDPSFITIPKYSNVYTGKYYISNKWYEDAEGTIPFTPS